MDCTDLRYQFEALQKFARTINELTEIQTEFLVEKGYDKEFNRFLAEKRRERREKNRPNRP